MSRAPIPSWGVSDGPVRALVALALMAVFLPTAPSGAGEQFRQLTAKEIRTRLVGRDLTDGVHWSWFYRSDGVLISVEMGKRREGTWKIEDNKLCSTNGRNRQLECYEAWSSGKKISLRYFADMPAIEGVLAPHAGP